jgi:hypothetical protein
VAGEEEEEEGWADSPQDLEAPVSAQAADIPPHVIGAPYYQ